MSKWVLVESQYREYDDDGAPQGVPTFQRWESEHLEVTIYWDGRMRLVSYDPDGDRDEILIREARDFAEALVAIVRGMQ